MSNYWLGEEYLHIRYSEEINERYPWIKYTAPYKDALYGLITLEPEGAMQIEGVKSEFVGPSPWELGYPHKEFRDRIVPGISRRLLKLWSV